MIKKLSFLLLISFLISNNTKAQCTYASTQTITAATFLACGTVTINAGVTLTVTGAVTNNTAGANIVVTDNGSLVFSSGITLNSTGNLSVTGTGSMSVSGGLTINSSGSYTNGVNTSYSGSITGGNSGSVTNTGTLTVTGSITLNSNGGLTNSGTIVAGSLTIANSGGVTNTGSFSVTGSITQNSSGGFTDNGTLTVGGNYNLQNSSGISGTGTAYVGGTASTTSSGTFWGSSGCTGCTLSSSGALLSSCDFKYRRLITIHHSQVSGGANLTNFPMLINIASDATLKSVANGGHVQNANGYDIIFTAVDGVTNLNFQLEKYVATTGQYAAWVNIPSLSATTETYIYMYYGDASVSTDQSTTSTWDANHIGVWHLDNNSFADATSNGNTGTNNNSTNNSGGGEVVDARTFAGSTGGHTTDYVHLPISGASTSAGTIELWGKITTFNASTYFFGHSSTQNGTYTDRIQLYQNDAAGTLELGMGGTHALASVATLAINTWNHIVLTWSAGNYVVYVNGVSKASGAYTNFSALASFGDIGNDGNAGQETEALTGSVDEVHISKIARTAGWITTEYNNQSSPSTFYTLASEPNTWTGGTSTAWNVGTNWSSGTAPAAASGADIIIANGTFQPSLSANTQVNSIYINSGATLSLGTKNLSVYADITNCGTLQGGTGTIILNGSSAQLQTLSGSGTYNIYDLTVNNTSGINPGVKLVQNVTVNDIYTHTTGTLDLNSHGLTISPTAAATSNFTAGSIITSVAGGSMTITDVNTLARMNFNGTNFGDATNGVTINCSSNDSYFNGGVFYGTVNFTKTGNGMNDCAGGCTFYGPCTWNTQITSDRWRMGCTNPDIFYNATFNHLDTTSGSNFSVARSMGNHFYGTTTIYSAAQGGFYVGRSNNTTSGSATFHGPVTVSVTAQGNCYFGESNGTINNTATFQSTLQLNSTASSTGDIYVGWNNANSAINFNTAGQIIDGTINGATNIYFYGVNQSVVLANVTTNSGPTNSNITIGSSVAPCSFKGGVTFSAPNINIAYSKFYGASNNFAMNGTTNSQTCTGGNSFATGTTTNFVNSGTQYWRLANTAADTIYGDITFNRTSTGALSPTYATGSYFYGNISILAGSDSIDFASGAGGRVILSGTTSGSFSSTGIKGTSMKRITMNKTGGASFTLNNPVGVQSNGDLTLTSGLLNTSAGGLLTLQNPNVTTTAVTDASTSYVNGPLAIQKATAAKATLNFPIGVGGDCRPVTLSVAHTTTNLYNYTAQAYAGNAFSVGTYTNYPATVDTLSGVHYWQIARTDASSVSQPTLELNTTAANLPQVTLYFGTDDQVYDGGLLTVCKTLYTDAKGWYDIGRGSTTIPITQQATAQAGTITSSNAGPTAFNSFSYFTLGRLVGAGKNPLPIALLNFNALPNGEQVNISWKTSTEVNNNYFTVERSEDGKTFTELTTVNSKGSHGNSTVPLSYETIDSKPLTGVSYYRLKQTDYNNNFKIFNIVSVDFEAKRNITFSIYPNPNSGEFTIDFSGIENNHEVQIILHDGLGREVYSQTLYSNSINSNKVKIVPTTGITKGNYECSLIFEGIVRTITVMVN